MALLAVHTLVTVGDVKEEIFFMMFLVQLAHGGGGRGNDVVYEEEESILGPEVDSLSDEKVKLTHRQVRGDQVFLLV